MSKWLPEVGALRARTMAHVLYLWLVIGGGLFVLASVFPDVNLDHSTQYLALIALGMVAEWLVVSFPHGQLSSGFAAVLAAFLLFGYPAAAWVGALAILFGQGIANRGNPMRTTLFNAGQCVLAIAAGTFVYTHLNGAVDQRWVFGNVIPVLGFTLTQLVANHLMVYLYLAPNRRSFPSIPWRNTLVWDAGTYLFVLPLAYLMAIIHVAVGPLPAFLLFLPALGTQVLLRHTVRLELSNRELNTLYEVAKRLGASVQLRELLDLILAETRRILPYHTAVVYVWDNTREVFSCAAVKSALARDLQHSSFGPDEGFAASVIRDKEPIVVYDARNDDRLGGQQGLPQFLRSLIIVPLLVEDQVSGVLVVGTRRPGMYSERNLHILTIVAGQAAVAINNALLYERVEQLTGRDPLTGFLERRSFLQAAEEDTARCAEGRPASVALFRINGLREFNRRYGYQAGDALLQQVARFLSDRVDDNVPLGRWGGSTLAVFLGGAGEVEAARVAERFQRAVEQHYWPLPAGQSGAVKVLLPFTTASCVSEGGAAEALIRAEESLAAGEPGWSYGGGGLAHER